MPSLSSSSSIRVASEDSTLHLKVAHNLVHGSPSDVVRNVRGRFPKELDVLWLSDIVLSLQGSVDAVQIPPCDIARSGLAHHLQTQLRANADRLGLNNVSRPFVDDADGFCKLTLTPSRPLPHASRPHVNLVSLNLAYIWRTAAGRDEIGGPADPFSTTLFLPAEALLNRVTEQFLIYHVVGRYPLIFGPWCKRLDLEMQYFPSIGHSIVEMMSRSNNRGFVSKCKRLLKIARRQHKFVIQTCSTALSSCIDESISDASEGEIDNLAAPVVLTDEQILCERLEQLFRMGDTRRRFKPAATAQDVSRKQDDDDGLLSPIHDEGIEKECCWVELPEYATSPLSVDWNVTQPEEMNILEDFPENEIWRPHEADTSVGERELDAQSDKSLISAPISFASTSTGPLPVCAIAVDQEQGFDDYELSPVTGGRYYDVARLDLVEDAGMGDRIRSESHAPHAEKHGLVMGDAWPCQVDSESFERLDSCSEGDDEEELLLFEDLDAAGAEVELADALA